MARVFMSNSGLLENKVEKKMAVDFCSASPSNKENSGAASQNLNSSVNFCWKASPAVRRVLDVISTIIAKEYIRVAKEKPELFCEAHKGDSHKERDSHLCADGLCTGGNK
jgi:hypothetical protein